MILIRTAMASDLARIIAIVDEAYSPYVRRMGKKPGPMLDDYAALIAEGAVHVAETGGAVVGLVVLEFTPERALLDNVAVADSVRGQGVGLALIIFAEQQASLAGHAAIELYTHERMTENIALYSRIGFVESRRATEKGFARIYMRKALRA